MIKKVVHTLIIISLIFSSSANTHAMAIDEIGGPSKTFDFDFESFFENYSQNPNLPESEQQKFKELLRLPTSMVVEVLYLWAGLEKKIQSELKNSTVEKLHHTVIDRKDSTSIFFEVDGIGKAELTTLGTSPDSPFFYKIRHNGIKIPIVVASSQWMNLSDAEKLPSSKLSEQEQKEQLAVHKTLSKEWRKLVANLLNAEWNEQNKYTPLPQVLEEEAKRKQMSESELKKYLDDLAKKSAVDLEKMGWYQKKVSKLKSWYHISISDVHFDQPTKRANDEVIAIFVNPDTKKIDKTEFHKKPAAGSLASLRMMFNHYFEPPSYSKKVWNKSTGLAKLKVLATGDYLFSTAMGLSLGSLSYATGALAEAHGQLLPGLSPMDMAVVTFFWSFGMAVLSKPFFQKWFLKGTEMDRFKKNQAVGLLNSLNLIAVSDVPIIPLQNDLSVNPESVKVLTDVAVNQIIKNYSKSFMYEIPKYREKTGASAGNIIIPYYVPKFFQRDESGKNTFFYLERREFDTDIRRSTAEMQSVQFVTTPISLLSRLGIMVPLLNSEQIQSLAQTLGTSEVTLAFLAVIPVGHLTYVALGPIAQKINMLYRKYHMHNHIRERQQIAQERGTTYNSLHDAQVVKMKREIDHLQNEWEKLKLTNKTLLHAYAYVLKVIANMHKNIFAPIMYKTPGLNKLFLTELENEKTAYDAAVEEKFKEVSEAYEQYKNGPYMRIPFTGIFRFYKQATADVLMTLPKYLAKIAVQTEYRFRHQVQEDLKAENLLQERLFLANPVSCSSLFY